MGRALNSIESQWIDKLLSVAFMGKEILQKQLNKSTVTFNEEFSFVSLKFSVDDLIDKFPYNIRVPVEMRAFQKNSTPIVFLLHIIDGYINELEILTADSSKLDVDSIELETVEFDIDKRLAY